MPAWAFLSFVPLSFAIAHTENADALRLPKPPSHAVLATSFGRSTFTSSMGICTKTRSCLGRCGPELCTPIRLGLRHWHISAPQGLQDLQTAQHKNVVPFLYGNDSPKWCRHVPANLFQVVWTALFALLAVRSVLQACTCRSDAATLYTVEDAKTTASWRFAPARFMPGTDVGSARQES